MSRAILRARGLVLAFGGVRAADGIDLDVLEGEVLAIIGPNGAGKTTFLNMVTGYLKPQAGSIQFADREITRLSPRRIVRLGIARSFQIPQLFREHSVLANIALALAAGGDFWSPHRPLLTTARETEAQALLQRFGLADLAQQRADALDEGARKLLDVAMAAALAPRLLLMDEPTSGVATAQKHAIMDRLIPALRQQGVTVVFVEHDMEVVARYADRVAVWSQGKILAEGPAGDVLADPTVRRDVIGLEGAAC